MVRCPSVRPSVCPSRQPQQQTSVCCCGSGGQDILIDCCTAGAQQQRRAAGECGQCHVVSVRRMLNTDLYKFAVKLSRSGNSVVRLQWAKTLKPVAANDSPLPRTAAETLIDNRRPTRGLEHCTVTAILPESVLSACQHCKIIIKSLATHLHCSTRSGRILVLTDNY